VVTSKTLYYSADREVRHCGNMVAGKLRGGGNVGALVPLLMILMFVDLTPAECWLAERSVYREHHRRVKTHFGKISELVTCGAAWNPTIRHERVDTTSRLRYCQRTVRDKARHLLRSTDA
jgi:hypothetical protein